ncbi:hepatic leukemia factor-like [Euwallacea fornicatus]|uniref:hepatic leukemia factor-like n=1 Tax=Euwallacea fornicatus TaxID=995702 RepID=UPI00338E68CE
MNSIQENSQAFGRPLRAHQHIHHLDPSPYGFQNSNYQGALCYSPYLPSALQVATEPVEYQNRTPPSCGHPISPPSITPRLTIHPYLVRKPIAIPPQLSSYPYLPTPSQTITQHMSPITPPKRPFKALTTTGAESMVSTLHPALEAEFETLKDGIMASVAESGSNRNMRRNFPVNPEKMNDQEYLERRRKNNEAAKRSREARKTKEDETAIRVKFLDGHAVKIAYQLSSLEREKMRLTAMLNRVFNNSIPTDK